MLTTQYPDEADHLADIMSGSVPDSQIVWVLLACAVLAAVSAPLSLRLFDST